MRESELVKMSVRLSEWMSEDEFKIKWMDKWKVSEYMEVKETN